MTVVEAGSVFQWISYPFMYVGQAFKNAIISQYANQFKSCSLFPCRNLAFFTRLRVRGNRPHQNCGGIKVVAVIRKASSNAQTVATNAKLATRDMMRTSASSLKCCRCKDKPVTLCRSHFQLKLQHQTYVWWGKRTVGLGLSCTNDTEKLVQAKNLSGSMRYISWVIKSPCTWHLGLIW